MKQPVEQPCYCDVGWFGKKRRTHCLDILIKNIPYEFKQFIKDIIFSIKVYNLFWKDFVSFQIYLILNAYRYTHKNEWTGIVHIVHCYETISCNNVAVAVLLKKIDTSESRLRLHRISAMEQQWEWITTAVFRTFPNLVNEK